MVDAIRLVARAHTDCYPSPDLKLGLLRCLSEYQPTGVLPCRLLGPLLDGFGQVRCVGVHPKAAAKKGTGTSYAFTFCQTLFLLFLFLFILLLLLLLLLQNDHHHYFVIIIIM